VFSLAVHRLRTAARSVVRARGFAVMAVLTLALGIGLSTAVFTVADAVLLRRLPVADQDRVVLLWGTKSGDPIRYPLSVANARAFVRETRAFGRAAVTTYEGVWPTPIREGDHVSRINRALVSGNFFDVLGARPFLGRALDASDDRLGAAPAAVLSFTAWQRRFGARPDIVGQRIVPYDTGAALRIVGVMPPGLDYPKGADLWTAMFASVPESGVQFMSLDVIGRLAPRATAANARDELSAFYRRPEMSAVERTFRGASETLPQAIVGETTPAVLAVAIASGLLLLITCLNVANLLVVRGLSRTREMAVRAALGGSRAVLVAQLLVENAFLALAGGALGFALAAGAVRSFVAFAPPTLPRLGEIRLDTAALLGAITITTLAMSLFAVAPTLLTSRVDAQEALRAGAWKQRSRRSRLLTEGLVAAQVALATLVLSGASVVTRSLIALERVDFPFDPSRMIVADLSMRSDQYGDVAKQRVLVERVVERLGSVPGVRSVAPVVARPYAGTGGWDGHFVAEGQTPAEAAANPMVDIGVVTPDFFATLGLRPLAGRLFELDDREGTAPVVVISESVARHYWPGRSAIGKRFVRDEAPRYSTVIGIVPDLRYRELREPRASIYYPLRQSPFPFVPTVLVIRTRGDPAPMITTIRLAVADADPGVAIASIAPFETFLARPLAQPRVNALLLSVFAAAAVLLCAVGVLGVMLTMVRHRTRELSVRLALGARPAELRRMVLARGVAIAGLGAVVGLAAAFALNGLLTSMVYRVNPTDGATLAASAVFLVTMAALASTIPAHAVTRLDAVAALRSEG
jgi:predicted permease